MKTVTFDDLAGLPFLRHYAEAFRKATRVTLNLLPPDEQNRRVGFRQEENAFCELVGSTPAGCAACQKTQRGLQRSTAKELAPQQVYCFSGLTDIAIPVMVGRQHVATLLSGQIFRREPTPHDFEMALKKLGGRLDKRLEKKARKAYFETPVIPADNLHAIVQLLTVFALHLPEDAGRQLATDDADLEPAAVSNAKKFIHSHSEEPVTLEQVLQHVHVSRFHFCRIFKKSTGVTFTEYMSRIHVAKAKNLLLDPSLRISEIAFAAGFGSIPQFNNVFKSLVGMSPTEYRKQLPETQPK